MYSCEKLFAELDRLEEKYIDFWRDICNIESPTEYKAGVDAVGKRIAEIAAKSGFSVEFIPQERAGDLVKITYEAKGKEKEKEKPFLLSAHIDTVHARGSFGTPPVTVKDGIMYGPGVIDDKGGAAASLYAMAALAAVGYQGRNVVFIAQTDEEVSSRLSDYKTIGYMIDTARSCEALINCESLHKGEAILRRKGIAKYRFRIKGKAVHASACDKGKSALLEAAHKIIEIEKFKDGDGITCSCSLMRAGEVSNTVPDQSEFWVDARYFSEEEYKRVDAEMKAIAEKSYIGETACELECMSLRPAMELNALNRAFLDKINRIYVSNGMETLKIGTSRGGSDAANISAAGVRTVDSLGCEGGKIHTTDEFAYIRSLKEAAKRIASIIYCYDEPEIKELEHDHQ